MRPTWLFRERIAYDLFIEHAGAVTLQTWLGEQEQTHVLRQGNTSAYWPLNWGDYVGLSRLRIAANGQVILDLPVEVRSHKIGYEQDYQRLLDELTDWLAALAFSVQTPTNLPTVVAALEHGSLYLAYLILRRLLAPDGVPAAFERVRQQPHRRLVREPRRVDFAQARQLDARALADLVAHSDAASTASCLALVRILWEVLSMPQAPAPSWWLDTFCSTVVQLEGETRYQSQHPAITYTGPLWRFTRNLVQEALAQNLTVVAACDTWYSGAYLLETVPSVLYILCRHADDPETALVRAVNDTKDNDTIAAIVGAVVGALHGAAALPRRWIDGLLGRTGSTDDGRIFELIEQARDRWSPA